MSTLHQSGRTATVQAGASWRPVIDQAAEYGLAPLSGSAPDVGAISYVLGGGLGLLARRFGYAADHVRGIDVVTADGQLRHVGPGSDLFWALRGGRGNFGVVTSIEVDLFPVATLYGGGLYFDTDLIPEVLDTWRTWTATVPDEMTSSVGLVPVPDIPQVPEPIRGRHVAHVRIAYLGNSADSGDRLVAPLRGIGPRLIDTLGKMPYTESGSITNDPTMPHGYYGDNVMLTALEPSLVDAVLDTAGPDAALPCVVEFRHLGGALARPPAAGNAVGHRSADYLLRILSQVGEGDDVAAAHQPAYDAAAPWTIGRCLNFVYGHNSQDFYEAADYRRLCEIKARHDPGNLFRLDHAIPRSPLQ